jgi:hypothetical protein
MSIVVPNASEILLLEYILSLTSPGNKILHLYKNDLTPVEATVIGNITESTETGYVPITLTGASWSVTQLSGITTGVYSKQTFAFATAATVYGYYVTTTSNQLLWVERFSNGPFPIDSSGGNIKVTPQVELE